MVDAYRGRIQSADVLGEASDGSPAVGKAPKADDFTVKRIVHIYPHTMMMMMMIIIIIIIMIIIIIIVMYNRVN